MIQRERETDVLGMRQIKDESQLGQTERKRCSAVIEEDKRAEGRSE